ncbi:hypothetical protein KJ705_00920 [Patescibacteria group bacterium]|nr:hypothetical protein [Patescibacteria group bacterium]
MRIRDAFRRKDDWEKHSAQIRRIVNKDFPWMWAVSHSWLLSEQDIVVLRGPVQWQPLCQQLRADCQIPENDPRGALIQAFIYVRESVVSHTVREVQLHPDKPLATCIYESFTAGEAVLNIVLVFDTNHEWKRLYQIHDNGAGNFNTTITQTAP